MQSLPMGRISSFSSSDIIKLRVYIVQAFFGPLSKKFCLQTSEYRRPFFITKQKKIPHKKKNWYIFAGVFLPYIFPSKLDALQATGLNWHSKKVDEK